jgi:hypothetical protein
MIHKVHILATVRNPALLQAACLVFKTLRVGFPTAQILVHGNRLEWFAEREIKRLADGCGAAFVNMTERMSHDRWIENLMWQEQPYWYCDTDIVFFGPVEDWFISREDFAAKERRERKEEVVLAGRLEPAFREEWTQTLHVERLHTALLYVNPLTLRLKQRGWTGALPALFDGALLPMVRQCFIPNRSGATLFYDTCAGLWQAGIGTPFTEEQNAAFEHLHCATYVDQIGPHLSLPDLAAAHRAIYQDPQSAKGLQRQQALYYESRKVTHAI